MSYINHISVEGAGDLRWLVIGGDGVNATTIYVSYKFFPVILIHIHCST